MAAMRRIEVALSLVERDGRWLVSRRSDGRVFAGYWEFPGGRVEAGESPAQAAIRETREETGVHVEVVSQLGQVETQHSESKVVLYLIRCRILQGEPEPKDASVTEIRWATLPEIEQLSMPPANWMIIQRLKEMPQSNH